MDSNKNIKIGARNLDDEELKILLPEWENIFLEINKIREVANSNKIKKDSKYKTIFEEEPEFTKYHNNVFSILGERGAGKTSVQLSLKYKLMKKLLKEKNIESTEEYKNDTVLPLIVPQDMEEDSSAIGWIIAYFSDIVEKIENTFKEDRQLFYYKKDIRQNPVLEKLKIVKKAFFIRRENYKNSISSDNSITEYIERNGEAISEDINLSKKFKEFIDEYIDYKKSVDKRNTSEPLIHIFFDDVDISNKKCLMVLETIMRYLSHANIVVFVAGDYSTFKETITLKYLKDDGLLYKDLLNETFEKRTALEIRQTLAYDYLKKVLSPALRYELRKYTLEEKKNFKYVFIDEKSLSLEELIKEKIGENFIEAYYELLDSKPRGLINIYYFLKGTESYKNLDEESKINFIKRLVSILIDSSSILNTEKEKIATIIVGEEKKINIKFEKFRIKDFSEENLLILYLVLFIKNILNENSSRYDNEIQNYFIDYFKENLNTDIKSYNLNTGYDIFFNGENLFQNTELFYKINKELEKRKIDESDFIWEYFEQLSKILGNKKITEYYIENLFYNKNKIKKIIKSLEQSNKILENKAINEMKVIFKNLYLIDEVKNIIDTSTNEVQNDWEKRYIEFKERNNLEEIKKNSWFCLNSDFNEINFANMSVMETNLVEKIESMEQDLEKIIETFKLLKLESPNKLNEIIELEKTSNNMFYLNFKNESLENKTKKIFDVEKKYSEYMGIRELAKITIKIQEGTLEKDFMDLSRLSEKIKKLKESTNEDTIKLKGENIIKEIEELYREGSLKDIGLSIYENLPYKFDFVKRHYILLNETLKYNTLSKTKEELRKMKFRELREIYIKVYTDVINTIIYKKYKEENKKRKLEIILEEIDDELYKIEERLVLKKELILVENSRIVRKIKEDYEDVLNSNNYISKRELKNIYSDYLEDLEENNKYILKKRQVRSSFINELNLFVEKEVKGVEEESFILASDLIDLEIYLNLFKMFLNEKNKKDITNEKLNERIDNVKKIENDLKKNAKISNMLKGNK